MVGHTLDHYKVVEKAVELPAAGGTGSRAQGRYGALAMTIGKSLGVLALLCGMTSPSSPSGGQEAGTPHLAAALETAHWLRSQTVEDGSLPWIPDEVSGPSFSAGIGSGAAGRALFFVEVAYATGDSAWLDAAMDEARVAASLVGLAPSEAGSDEAPLTAVAAAATPATAAPPAGLYDGLAGVGFTLAEVARAAGRESFREQAAAVFDRLASEVERDENGVYWNDRNDVLTGTAGIGLALLYAHAELAHPEALALAIEAGDALVARAEPVGEELRWLRGAATPFDLPNFSHGTAGAGYFLTALYAATGEDRFLVAARRAARYLLEIAEREDGLFLVPYGVPNDGYVTAFDIGWAHGPAGTARLFYLLWTSTGDEEHEALVRANAATLAAAGMPGASADPRRWTGPFKIDRRFGTSGAADFLLKLYASAPRAQYLELGRRLVEDILRRSTTSATERFWTLPLYGFQGDDGATGTFTGYFYGAAGLGLTLLEMHYAEIGVRSRVRFPDDPFPKAVARVARVPRQSD